NPYMNGSMVPLPDNSVAVTMAGAGIHLHGTSNNMKIDEDFDNNMLLTQVVVDSPEMKVVAVPTYMRADDGLVVSAVTSQLNQPPSAPPMQITFHVEYEKVDSFQIPSRVVYDLKNVGIIEIGFNTCRVSLTDPAQSPGADNPAPI